MPTIFDNLTAIPTSFVAGEAITWVETLTDYPIADYSVAYKFTGRTPLDGLQQFGITGTESGTATYTFTTLTTYKPGNYCWEKQITRASGSVMRVVERGDITVIPNAGTTPTETSAAEQVALLKTALAELNATTNTSVSFNGQSFAKANIGEYKSQLVYWQAQVKKEQDAYNALAGCGHVGGRIALEFVTP